MNFENILRRAKQGDRKAQEEIFRKYQPLLVKHSMDMGVFDEDLFQELSATLLHCIELFNL